MSDNPRYAKIEFNISLVNNIKKKFKNESDTKQIWTFYKKPTYWHTLNEKMSFSYGHGLIVHDTSNDVKSTKCGHWKGTPHRKSNVTWLNNCIDKHKWQKWI